VEGERGVDENLRDETPLRMHASRELSVERMK